MKNFFQPIKTRFKSSKKKIQSIYQQNESFKDFQKIKKSRNQFKSANTIQIMQNNHNEEIININDSEGFRSNKLLAMLQRNRGAMDLDEKPKDRKLAFIQTNAIANSFSASAKRLRIPLKTFDSENSAQPSPTRILSKNSIAPHLKMQFESLYMRQQEKLEAANNERLQ